MAIICCSSDIPVARKLCKHISALAACHRYYKRANNGNFSGFDDMAEWFKTRDLEEFCKDAVKWRNCKSKNERNYYVSNNLVSWIVKHLWIDRGKISKDDLKIMEKRAEAIKPLADMG
ncbi:hypothetical protein GLOIN_2v1776801 [Rhizophagus clarus]|uniref:Uncharacterized protein n=1 Tax=Rhizophagus clarus TaxID=94130 RepID=A0A8H3QVN7_9GLOM|nr:hypothetical protein GLOIN_2v1776801 [Rhizophagus clarus]